MSVRLWTRAEREKAYAAGIVVDSWRHLGQHVEGLLVDDLSQCRNSTLDGNYARIDISKQCCRRGKRTN